MARAVLVFNRSSGAHLGGERRRVARARSAALLTSAGLEVTQLKGSLRRQIPASLTAEGDVLVVDGGDGTIRAVIAAHLADAERRRRRVRRIGILPSGTMNLLAQDCGVPLDRDAAARAIAGGAVVPIDVGCVDGAGGRRREIVLHSFFAGLPVRVGTHRERLRGRMTLTSRAVLLRHALATAWRDRPVTAHLPDGSALAGRSFGVFVGEVAGRLLPVPQRSAIRGGQLTVIAVAADTGLAVMRLALRGALDRIEADPDATLVRADEISLTTPRRHIHLMLDGESALMPAPLAVTVMRDAVDILSPAGTHLPP